MTKSDEELIESIHLLRDKLIHNGIQQWINCNNNRSEQKIVISKFPQFRRRGGKKIKKHISIKKLRTFKLYTIEILDWYKNDFTSEERNRIENHLRDKIKGVYKHAQAYKTGYLNMIVIQDISSEENRCSICISKNTLEGNTQWLERLASSLSKKYPSVKTSDIVMIISSKKNTLNGRATHCKNMAEGSRLILSKFSKFKIVVVCSNSVRLNDILDLTDQSSRMRKNEGYKNFRIIHDEAHNQKEGIPAYRDVIECILMQPNVFEYNPCTATNPNIEQEGSRIWLMSKLEENALDYTKNFDDTKSDNPNYSSCNDAERVSFESLKDDTNWKDYGIDAIPREDFESSWRNGINDSVKGMSKVNSILAPIISNIELPSNFTEFSRSEQEKYLTEIARDYIIDKKRKLDYCPTIAKYKEKEAVNRALNIILNDDLTIWDRELDNKFSLRLMTTPMRVSITHYLAHEAAEKGYNSLAIYNDDEFNKYHLFIKHPDYGNVEQLVVDEIMDQGEFNVKLEKLFNYLSSLTYYNNDKPFWIISNYINTGESITFVNYSYGTLDVNVRLISTSASDDYQQACRSNYMTKKFIENNSEFIIPKKYLIGSVKYLRNVIAMEESNDYRIECFTSGNSRSVEEDDNLIITSRNSIISSDSEGCPIKLDIYDMSDEIIVNILNILDNNKRCNDQKNKLMLLLKQAVDNGIIEIVDKNEIKHFNINTYKLITVRSYKKNHKAEGYRFDQYQYHHKHGSGYINEKNKIQRNECELLVPYDMWIIRNEDNSIKCKNKKSEWWIGYKY